MEEEQMQLETEVDEKLDEVPVKTCTVVDNVVDEDDIGEGTPNQTKQEHETHAPRQHGQYTVHDEAIQHGTVQHQPHRRHDDDVTVIVEESRSEFNDDDDPPPAKYYTSANETIESSSDCGGDSSCSNDLGNHTVKADLYGTDRDPSYQEDADMRTSPDHTREDNHMHEGAGDDYTPRKPDHSSHNAYAPDNGCHSPAIRSHLSSCTTTDSSPPVIDRPSLENNDARPVIAQHTDLNNNTVQYSGHPPVNGRDIPDDKAKSAIAQVEVKTEDETASSFRGLFHTSGVEVRSQPRSSTTPIPAAAVADIEVYRRSYMQAQYGSEQHPRSHNTEGYPEHGPSPRQSLYPTTDQQQHQKQFNGGQAREQRFCAVASTREDEAHRPTPSELQHNAAAAAAVQHYQKDSVKAQLYSELAERQYLSPASYKRGFTDEHNIAAEQLASELVKTYGGQNSHMISEILKASEDGCGFTYGGFERQAEMDTQSGQQYSTPQMIHDVLNTPQQLSTMDDEYPEKYAANARRSSCATETFSRKHGKVNPDPHGSVTYNDVHGGKWSSGKYGLYPSQIQEENISESPFPTHTTTRRNPDRNLSDPSIQFPEHSVHPNQHGLGSGSNHNRGSHAAAAQIPFEGHHHQQQQLQSGGQEAAVLPLRNFGLLTPPQGVPGSVRDAAEITKTTFTSREHMLMHLGDKVKYKFEKDHLGNGISEGDYSNIYPSRDFIEHTAGTEVKSCNKQERSEVEMSSSKHSGYDESETASKQDDEKHYAHFQDRPTKKRRISKYNTDELRVPPQMPLFEDTIQKYATVSNRDDAHASRHKYFVVNPSEVTNMPPKDLVTKYIDFLIKENEQITDISKSVNPPVDIYVTEDMYFMDSLKYQVPFPSKKFVEWVGSFYPRLSFYDMKFKGQHPQVPTREALMRADARPTQQILEDTFYYFQREVMNRKK